MGEGEECMEKGGVIGPRSKPELLCLAMFSLKSSCLKSAGGSIPLTGPQGNCHERIPEEHVSATSYRPKSRVVEDIRHRQSPLCRSWPFKPATLSFDAKAGAKRIRMKGVLCVLILVATLLSVLSAEAQTSGLRWARANATGVSPTPRIDAPIAYDVPGGRLLMFGGQDATGGRNDLWSYSVDRQQWMSVNPRGVPPNPPPGHTVTLDRFHTRIIFIAAPAAQFSLT